METRWIPIIPVLEEFQSFLSNKVPKLEIINANDRNWPQERYESQEKTGIFDKYGIYLIFNDSGKLQYVGVSMQRFHNRIWKHDFKVQRRWTDVIPFEHENYFLALALEFFLIAKLTPKGNREFKNFTIK